MIELPDDAEYQRLSRAAARPAARARSRARPVPAGVLERAPGTAARLEPVPALPVDTDPPPGWLPTPESRAAMDALLPPMRAEPEPVASPGAAPLTVADAIPALRRLLDDPNISAADAAALVLALSRVSDAARDAPSSKPLCALTHAELVARVAEIDQRRAQLLARIAAG